MKTFIIPFILFLSVILSCSKNNNSPSSPTNPGIDSFTVTVNNGYGSGKYKVGDTVHIFSVAYNSNQVFGTWSGSDASLLNGPNEWHTWFVMPAKNETFTGSVQNIQQPFTLKYEQIKGQAQLKPVYYYFPANQVGIVYLLHGTGGNAQNIVTDYEWRLIINDLVNNNYAVIITESEQSTIGGTDSAQWKLIPWDTTTNVDLANIRIITDTFYNRGVTNRSIPQYSIGMSNGGLFSTGLSTIYKFKAGVSYCAPSGDNIAQITQTPLQFCMQEFDNVVGPTGNANALDNSQTLISRGICSKYLIHNHSPLYPQRFARDGTITLDKSASIFNELKANGFLDSKNYFKGYSEDLQNAYKVNKSAFPQLQSLTAAQQQFVLEQISDAVAEHHIYSDYNRATLSFLASPCK